MPLSKKKQAEWMRNYRASVIPKLESVIPKYNILKDPALLALNGHLPNCPDGRYRDKEVDK